LVILCSYGAIFAQQEEFITPILSSTIGKGSSPLEKFINKPYKKSIQLVKIGNPKNLIKNKKLKFTIPGYSKKLTANIISVETTSDDYYNCFGQFEDDLGTIVIVAENGKITAHIAIEDKIFEIYYNDDDTNTLIELDTEAIKKKNSDCGQSAIKQQSTSEKGAKVLAPQAILPCQTVAGARIIVLTTAAARLRDPNINQTINLAITQYNAAITSSSISVQSAKLVLGGIFNSTIVENGQNIDNDILNLPNNLQAQQLRTENAADLVVLITNAGYGGGSIYGVAREIASTNGNSYAIVEIDFASSIYTFAHEVGHLLGGRHQDDNDPTTTQLSPYAKGYKFDYKTCWLCSRKYVRTVMHRNLDGYTRILNFSNPDVSISGVATGNTTVSNVARKIGEFAPTIATYCPERLGASISGPSTVATLNTFTWEAMVSCGSGYTYQWAESSDGFNYLTMTGVTGMTLTQFVYPGGTFKPYKRVTVRSTDGQVTNAFIYISVPSSSARIENKEGSMEVIENSTISDTEIEDEIITYPNPLENKAKIEVLLQNDDKVRLDLLDNAGNHIKNYFDSSLKKGLYDNLLDASQLKDGIYLIKLTTSKGSVVKRIIVQK
jgi:hypothetical protein